MNYYCRTDIDKARVTFFSRGTDGWTDTILESSYYGNMSAQKNIDSESTKQSVERKLSGTQDTNLCISITVNQDRNNKEYVFYWVFLPGGGEASLDGVMTLWRMVCRKEGDGGTRKSPSPDGF